MQPHNDYYILKKIALSLSHVSLDILLLQHSISLFTSCFSLLSAFSSSSLAITKFFIQVINTPKISTQRKPTPTTQINIEIVSSKLKKTPKSKPKALEMASIKEHGSFLTQTKYMANQTFSIDRYKLLKISPTTSTTTGQLQLGPTHPSQGHSSQPHH